MAKRVSIAVECPHCGSVRRYLGDLANASEWQKQMADKTCSHCGKQLTQRKVG